MDHPLVSGQDMVYQVLGEVIGQILLEDCRLSGRNPDRRSRP